MKILWLYVNQTFTIFEHEPRIAWSPDGLLWGLVIAWRCPHLVTTMAGRDNVMPQWMGVN
jgi:hypothetical protein